MIHTTFTCAECGATAPARFTNEEAEFCTDAVYMLLPTGWNMRAFKPPLNVQGRAEQPHAQYEPVCGLHPEKHEFHATLELHIHQGLPFDQKHDLDAKCSRPGCTAAYVRHFDWMANYRPGCKYCDCPAFVESKDAATAPPCEDGCADGL